MDRLWLHASEDTFQSLIDIVNLAVATPVGSPAFNASQGYTGNGTSSYLDSGFVPSTSGVNYTQNSATLLAYIRNDRLTSAAANEIGVTDNATKTTDLMLFKAGTHASQSGTFGINDVTQTTLSGMTTITQGQWIVSRTTSTNIDIDRNESNVTSISPTSVGLNALSLYILARHTPVTATNLSVDQIAITGIFGAMNSTQRNATAHCINAYMASLTTNVY